MDEEYIVLLALVASTTWRDANEGGIDSSGTWRDYGSGGLDGKGHWNSPWRAGSK